MSLVGALLPAQRQSVLSGLGFKPPVQLITLSPITLSGQQNVNGYSTVDVDTTGYPTRVLVNGQTDMTENGIYTSSETGDWVFAPDNATMRYGTFVMALFGNNGYYPGVALWYQDQPDPVTPGYPGTVLNLTDGVEFQNIKGSKVHFTQWTLP